MQAFVPKTRRPKFELRLKIIDLNNVPLVSGTSYVKWHLPSSTSAEHRGRTTKSVIRDHKVAWDYEKILPVRLTVDRHGMLQESEIHFEVAQEYSSGVRAETIILGNVRLNLSEYVEGSDEGEDGVTRRYLMQESKINSTLKIGIKMTQIEGDSNFIAPPLKTAPVFGGIAGIMTTEQGEPDNLGHVPSISTKTREVSKLQDMYRQTLAASWAAQTGELPADQCIEELFAGGDGWGGTTTNDAMEGEKQTTNGKDGNESDGDRRPLREHGRKSSRYGPTAPKSNIHKRIGSRGEGHTVSRDSVSGRASIEQQVRLSNDEGERHDFVRARMHEVDEFSEREDLRSWKISTIS